MRIHASRNRAGAAVRAVALVVAAVPAVPAGGAAQGAGPDTIAPIPVAPITVTVLRSPFDAGRVPLSVTAVDLAPRSRAEPGLALDEALRAVPGVQVDDRHNYALGERISIRGFGARSQFGVRGVKVLVDGIPATLPDGQTTLNHVDLGSISRVEVIRGPASALYGNAAGGVVQLETETPPAGPIRQELRVLGGDHGLLRLESRTGGRDGRLSYRLGVTRFSYDGYRDHNAAGHLQVGARLGYHGDRSDLRTVFAFVDYDAENPGGLSAALLREDRSMAFTSNVAQRTGEEGRQAQLGVSWRRSFASGELELSTFGVTRAIDNPIPPSIIDLSRVAGGIRLVYRGGSSPAERGVRWTVGAEAEAQRDDRENYVNLSGERGDLVLDQRERVSAVGAFTQLSFDLTDRISLLGGVRYDTFRFRVDDHLVGAGDPDDSGTRAMDAVSPSVGVVYRAADAFGIFANLGTSFQTPTTTELANRADGAGGFNPGLEPERALAFEAGVRGRIAGRAAYSLSGYRAGVEDELIGYEVPTAPGRTFFRNAGSAVHRGIEAEASVAPHDDVVARVGYAYTDARFDRYRTGDDVLDGNRIPGVSPHRFEAEIGYRPAGWFVVAATRYVSRIPVDDRNTASSPPYAVTDLRLGLAGVRVRDVELAPFVGIDNLLDRRYNTSVVINAFGGRYFEPGPGRALYVGARVGFGGV